LHFGLYKIRVGVTFGCRSDWFPAHDLVPAH
jgi:hypothetical protein